MIDYPGEVKSPTTDIATSKTLIKSTISIPDAIFLCADISKFYLNKLMNRYEYMQLPFDIIPQDIINEANLSVIAHNRKVYINIRKCVYGITKDGIIAHDR